MTNNGKGQLLRLVAGSGDIGQKVYPRRRRVDWVDYWDQECHWALVELI